jgi:hypothetical protein
MDPLAQGYRALATYRHCTERIRTEWPSFVARRAERLKHGNESEMVAQAILEDLFTRVLDWAEGDFEYQVGRADIVLSRNLSKHLVIEAKRPGKLLPGRAAFEQALCQARTYADKEDVQRVAVSDGRFLYGLTSQAVCSRIAFELTSPMMIRNVPFGGLAFTGFIGAARRRWSGPRCLSPRRQPRRH